MCMYCTYCTQIKQNCKSLHTKRKTDRLAFQITCLWFSAACTEGRFSICWASRRLRALAKCCCCMVARMLTTAGCLFFSMLVKLQKWEGRRGRK